MLDAGWIDQATLCQGVEPGTVAACDAGGRRRRHGASGQRSRGHRVDGHGSGDDGRLTVPDSGGRRAMRRFGAWHVLTREWHHDG